MINAVGIPIFMNLNPIGDKEKQQPRSHRKLIGKLDPETGKMVPTDGRGKKKKKRP